MQIKKTTIPQTSPATFNPFAHSAEGNHKELLQLPKESGLNEANHDVKKTLAIVKTALHGLSRTPESKDEGRLVAHFYAALIQKLR